MTTARLKLHPKALMELPLTEQENPNTAAIDKVSTLEAARLINNEDKAVAIAIEKVLPEIGAVVD